MQRWDLPIGHNKLRGLDGKVFPCQNGRIHLLINLVTFRLFLPAPSCAVCAALAKELRLDSNNIGDIGAEKLAGALPNLTNLKETWLGSLSLEVGPSYVSPIRPTRVG